MKAWEIRNGDLGLHDVESGHPRDGEIVVRISHVGICGSDLPKLKRPHGYDLPEPWRPGHEIVGTDPIGRVVAVNPLLPCGTCPRCATGGTHLCAGLRRSGWDLPGGFAEQVVIPARNAHPILNAADRVHAVLADPAAAAIHGLRCNQVASLGRLAVIGAGTVGLLTALYAHRQGWEVTVVHRDGRAPRDAVARALPAEFRSPAAMPPNETFDLVVDAASGADPAPIALALRLVGDGGTVIVQNAYFPGVRLPVPLRDFFRRSIRLIGSFSHCHQRPGDFSLALDLLRSHVPQVAHLVAEAGELADLPAVLRGGLTRSVRQVLAVRTSQHVAERPADRAGVEVTFPTLEPRWTGSTLATVRG